MFTLDQILDAHGKVKSGADFPRYIQDIKKLGVCSYDAFVTDGHIDYCGDHDFKISGPAKYTPLTVAANPDVHQFKTDLKAHQQGKTDYFTFCNDCAKSGIAKWKVRIDNLTCTYYDSAGNELLIEKIPE